GTGRQRLKYPPARGFSDPDWTGLRGYRNVRAAEWESALWQRRNTVKNLAQLKAVFGPLLPDDLIESIARDQRELATMSLLLPPQMLNTMDDRDLWNDPVRRYMLPAYDDRRRGLPKPPQFA